MSIAQPARQLNEQSGARLQGIAGPYDNGMRKLVLGQRLVSAKLVRKYRQARFGRVGSRPLASLQAFTQHLLFHPARSNDER